MRAYRQSLLGLSCLTLATGWVGQALAAPNASGMEDVQANAPARSSKASQAADPVVEVRLAKGPLGAALFALGRQTGTQILFTSEMVAGRSGPAVSGRMTAAQALDRLLVGVDLEVQRMTGKVFVLRARAQLISTAGPARAQDTDADAPPVPPLVQAAPEDPTLLSEIVVGSHIRGAKDSASPVIILDRESLDRAGRTSVADALSALPQAFGGLGNEDASSTGADPTGTNSNKATGVNLRGLGTDATLVLVNGRRLAGTGLRGDFADVSSIPMAAVERIEVLLDGASALYGSDAVGGVVNIVLRKRFEGAETRALVGGTTQGGASQWSFGQTVGHDWDSGNLVVSYEHSARDRLKGRDRDYTGQADLRALGGTDHRRYYGMPGTILRANAAGVLVPAYAIPAGQNGTGLTPASFQAGTVNLENQLGAYDVLPRQRLDSLYVALAQDLTAGVSLSADARATRRRFTNRSVASSPTLTVNRNNPYFVSPTGQTSERIAYSFLNELGGQRVNGVADTLGLSFGGQARLPGTWRLDAYGAYGLEQGRSRTDNLVNTSYLSEALGTTANNAATPFSTAANGFFNPFIGQGTNPRTVLDFISGGYLTRKTRGETASVNLKLDGELFTLPAGAVGLAVGGQIRREALKTGGVSLTSGFVPTEVARRDVHRTIDAAFAEVRVPIFGGGFVRPGLQRLELSAAVRREDYGEIASTDPKVGVIWSPAAGLTVKASYGTSFRAPALIELNEPQIYAPTTLTRNGQDTIVMILYGGNLDLRPETATSKTLTLELAPARWPRFKASVTGFDTRFTDRIGQPGLDNLSTVLTAPEFAPFVSLVSPGSNPADLARIQALIDDPRSLAQGIFPAQSYAAIIDGRWVNTGQLRVRGFDISARYAAQLGKDPLALTADVTWLVDYQRKITPQARAVQQAGVAGQPADLRLRAAASWTHGALTTTAALSHVGDLRTETGGRIKPWTTADLNLTYGFKTGPMRGLSLALNVQNLLDDDPPFYDSNLGVGYDPANADPLGRTVTLQLTKTW